MGQLPNQTNIQVKLHNTMNPQTLASIDRNQSLTKEAL